MPDYVPRSFRGAAEAAPRGVQGGQYTADVSADECVVFLIGMRINRLRKVRSWWLPFTGMPRMLAELKKRPQEGLLGARSYWSGRVLMTVQYWRSAEDLGRYARDPSFIHQPTWALFNTRDAANADVGIFHETYVVPREGVESLYANMPAFGLALAHVSARRGPRRHTRAQDQLGQQDPEFVQEN